MLVIEGPKVNTEYTLEFSNSNNVTIGRKDKNEISLNEDHHLSNIHAKIYFYENNFYLEDMGSTNGYFFIFFIINF